MANGNRDIPGGGYTASDNGDGTYNLHDVPIFAELAKGQKRNPTDIDREWMESAVKRHKALSGEKYMAPVHVKHHDLGANTERAGFLLPKEVRLIQYGGKPTAALFADLLRIPAAIFNRIQKGELPYRSVEVGDWTKPEIASLALLDDEAPFFKFELLTVGRLIAAPKVGVDETPTRIAEAMSPVLAFAGPHILFRWETERLGEMQPPSKKKPGEEDEKPQGEGDGKVAGPPKVQPAQDGQEGQPAGQAGEQPPKQMQEALKGDGNITGLLQQILLAIQALAGQNMAQAPIQPNPGKPAEQPPAPPAQGNTQKQKFTEGDPMAISEDTKKLAEAAAEKCAAESKLKLKEQADAMRAMVDGAKLALKGYVLSEDTDKEILALAERGGKEAVDCFVEAFKKHVSPLPPPTLKQLDAQKGLTRTSAEPVEQKALEKFASDPAKLEKAKKFAAGWEQLKARGLTNVSLERHLDIQMAHAG